MGVRRPAVSNTLAAALMWSCLLGASAYGQGAYLSAGGPVHRGMGGASTAAPVNAIGALYWNPATISGLQHTELEFGLGLLYSNHEVSSNIGGLAGSTQSENGALPIPNVGWVYHTKNPAVTLGLGVNAVGGFKTNLRADPSNPILAPPPDGLGRVSSEASFLNLTPVLSLALTDRLSVAAGPIIGLGQLAIEPFALESPNLNGLYSNGRSTRYHWGGGAQLGVYYIHNEAWRYGASIKSPVWFETFRFFGESDTNESRILRADVDLPMIVSFGTSYAGAKDWLFAVDLRFMDYRNAEGFGDGAGWDAQGKLSGLGWDSAFGVSLGAQRKLSDKLYLRAGYTFTQNPVDDANSIFNIPSPLVYEHMLSCGGSYQLNDAMALNLAYSYFLENDVVGPANLPGVGVIPGSSVSNSLDVHMLSFGIVMRH